MTGRGSTVTTYGRWPAVAAALATPAWVAAALTGRGQRRARSAPRSRPPATAPADPGPAGARWVADLALPILLSHQTEEWVRPGGFLPFANEDLLGSERPDWPLTPRIGFHVNVTLGWGTAILGPVVWNRTPAVAAGVLGMEIGNAAMHLAMAVRRRRYNPGVVTAAVLMAPHAVAGIRQLRRSGRLTRSGFAGAGAIGAAFAALPVLMKIRMRRDACSSRCPAA